MYEAEVIKKDGGAAFLELNMSSVIEDGKFAGRFGVARDITERKRSEEKLRESENFFRVIFERSTVGKSLTSPEGKLLKVNQAFADMLGYTIEKMQSINFAEITHQDARL
nr:PAS domain S-box protein [FCB group bacterium]